MISFYILDWFSGFSPADDSVDYYHGHKHQVNCNVTSCHEM